MSNYSYIFEIFGKSLKIFGNWEPCLKDICSWYTMPPGNEVKEPELSLRIIGADIETMERLLPLPGMEYKNRSGVMEANEKYDFSSYINGERQWLDYAGAGRIMLDFSKGSALSLICGNVMLPTYQKYLFVDHPLGKLFTAKCVFSMHASCVAVNGKGIAFTGRSGAGKSTAAFALMQKGMPIIHDEKLFVQKKDAEYSAWSISDIVKVHDDALSRFFAVKKECREYDVISGEHYLKLGDSKNHYGKAERR